MQSHFGLTVFVLIVSLYAVSGQTCANYCGNLLLNCPVQYAAMAVGGVNYCTNFCTYFPNTTATTGDSLLCRYNNAALGGTNCSYAGQDGGNFCGSWCNIYCDKYTLGCNAAVNNFSTSYLNNLDCMQHCMSFPLGTPLDVSGDTFYCRQYHVSVAISTGPAATHCPHSFALSTNSNSFTANTAAPCGSPCDHYCDQMLSSCASVFADRPTCLNACYSYSNSTGQYGVTTGNSLFCRIYHANAAVYVSATTHCSYAGPSGGTMCNSAMSNLRLSWFTIIMPALLVLRLFH